MLRLVSVIKGNILNVLTKQISRGDGKERGKTTSNDIIAGIGRVLKAYLFVVWPICLKYI